MTPGGGDYPTPFDGQQLLGHLPDQFVVREMIEQLLPVTQTVPIFRLNFPGGDTRMVYNLEYRIPLFGPVTVL